MRLAAWIARTTESGAPAGMLALPPGRMVAVVAGPVDPDGAPGTPVVVVVPSVWAAAGAAAASTAANTNPANPSFRHGRGERDSKRFSSGSVPPGAGTISPANEPSKYRQLYERALIQWTIHCTQGPVWIGWRRGSRGEAAA